MCVCQVPCQRSQDGWLQVINGAIRRSFYVDQKAADLDVKARGGLTSNVGESPIDNTVLPNVLGNKQVRGLLASGHVRKFIIKSTARVQHKYLQAISQLLNQVSLVLCMCGHFLFL